MDLTYIYDNLGYQHFPYSNAWHLCHGPIALQYHNATWWLWYYLSQSREVLAIFPLYSRGRLSAFWRIEKSFYCYHHLFLMHRLNYTCLNGIIIAIVVVVCQVMITYFANKIRHFLILFWFIWFGLLMISIHSHAMSSSLVLISCRSFNFTNLPQYTWPARKFEGNHVPK